MIKLQEKLTKQEILKLFTNGFKNEQKIGMEYERLPICKSSYNAIDYNEGICDFLREFAKSDNWDYITDDYHIIGLKKNHDTVTLEPGSQIELSLEPEFTIFDLQKKFNKINEAIKPILREFGITLLNYGVQPLSTYKYINLIPKERYKIMAKYMWGILSDVMMRETAGVQACLDFKNEEDAMKKYKTANKLVPFLTAMYANSPIRGGVETGYKTFRGLSWLNTDNDRCGFACNFDDDFTFEKYIDLLIKSPMIFINKNKMNIAINGKINFEEYMNLGYEDFQPCIEDFELHANLYFPEVRLRNFIEVRNHDCTSMPFSVLAIYKGILYNENAISEIEDLLKDFSDNDFRELRYNVVKNALQTPVKNHLVKDYAVEILNIANKYLKEFDKGEEKFLEPITELTENGLCPADIILRNWNGLWNKDINKLVNYLLKNNKWQ